MKSLFPAAANAPVGGVEEYLAPRPIKNAYLTKFTINVTIQVPLFKF
jgi:hypothetical protein